MRDRQIFGGIMRSIDSVTDIGGLGKRLESVQETRRHVEVFKGDVVEQKGLLAAEGRGVSSNVDQYVVNGTMSAPHQLRLTTSGPAVHPANHSSARARLRVLNEGSRLPWCAEVVIEDVCVERSGEQPAVIVMGGRHEDENVCKISRFDSHADMLP